MKTGKLKLEMVVRPSTLLNSRTPKNQAESKKLKMPGPLLYIIILKTCSCARSSYIPPTKTLTLKREASEEQLGSVSLKGKFGNQYTPP